MPKAAKATPSSKATAAKQPAGKKKAAAKKAPAKKKVTTAKASPAKKAAVAAKKAPAKKVPPKKSSAKAAPAKKAPAKKAPVAAKAAKQSPPKPTKSAPPVAKKSAVQAKVAPAKKAAGTAAKTAARPAPAAPPARPAKKHVATPKPAPAPDKKFLEEHRTLLLDERVGYERQAASLKAEADQLAAEMEPGDVQFDEESGEGDSIAMERERDLQLAGQARAAIEEIDRALAKIDAGTYGICERCGQPIPRARLKALPYAALCVACKSGGLSSRR